MAPKQLFTVDGHLDLATNYMNLNRDLTKDVKEIRNFEKSLGLEDFQDRGKGTVSELRKGNTRFSNYYFDLKILFHGRKNRNNGFAWVEFPEQAFAFAMAQLEWYRQMESIGEMKAITNRNDLMTHLSEWNGNIYR